MKPTKKSVFLFASYCFTGFVILIFFLFAIFNWDLLQKIWEWFLNKASIYSFEFLIKIISILIMTASFIAYPLYFSNKLKKETEVLADSEADVDADSDADVLADSEAEVLADSETDDDPVNTPSKQGTSNEDLLKLLQINYIETEENGHTYLKIKNDVNYWLECVERLMSVITVISIYLTCARFFSTNSLVESVVSTISLLTLPVAVVFMYYHYSMKILFSLIWAKYPPLKNGKGSLPSDKKVSFFKEKETWPAIRYSTLVALISVPLIFYFPVITGLQIAPVKP